MTGTVRAVDALTTAMVTASHNPGADNGIKLCREEAKPIGQETGLFELRDAVISNQYKSPAETPGAVTEQDLSEAWIEHTLSFIDVDKLKELHIAVDAGNGMAGKIFPELEPYVPWQVEEMYFELDGTFPNHEANPLKFETLADLIAKIKELKLDGGIAFDGDGDRAFLVDETGTVLTGGVMSAMLVAGLELDFDEIARAGRRSLAGALVLSVVAIVAALGLASALGWSLWIGLAAGATSVPLLMAVLRELGHLSSPTGRRLVT